MEINKFLLVPFLFFLPLFAEQHAENCIGTSHPDFPHIDIRPQSNPLFVSGFIEVTATVTETDLREPLDKYKSVPSIDEIEMCFELQYKKEDFKIFSGEQAGSCDLFDKSRKVQRRWILEALQPGNHKISIDVSWKYRNGHEKHQIFPLLLQAENNVREILVSKSCEWYWNGFLNNWDKISIVFLAFASLIVSICALVKKQSS